MSRRLPTPHWNSGGCRWCGEAIENTTRRKRTWHPDCVRAYLIATQSSAQRSACRQRDKGICAKCGRDARSTGWQADHIVPLHLVDRSLPWAELKHFWSIDNLQTLCEGCHNAKSAAEAAARAERRRTVKQPRLDLVPA